MSHPQVPRSSALLRLVTVALVALLAPRALAQQVVNYDALPACAKTCETLSTAQDGCVPPRAQVTTQETYNSCFCQSAFLTGWKSSSQGVCDPSCTSSQDQTAVQQWFINFCEKGVGGVTSTAASSPGTSSTATSSATDSTSTTSSNTVIQDPDGDGDASNNYSGSWISSHWKWVIMLAVIFLAMIFFSVLGLWLKRRHRAKHDALRANLAAPEAGIGAVPPPPPMAHMKNHNDSGTLASTVDLSSTTAAGTPSRSRSRTNTLTRFPNGSMSNVAPPPVPVVWGPHQHQAATRGYEYHPSMSNSPGPSVPSTPVSIPTPSMTPVNYQRHSGGTNGKNRSQEVIAEAADEDRIEPMGGKESKLRRKLSKR
ncbi:integral membrane protein [Neofusicoccum parvum]|nr:integral membrane protein [Neofusicoccum parvum]